jgi:hypothetical protein
MAGGGGSMTATTCHSAEPLRCARELGITVAPDDRRRVLAVLAYLRR